MQTFIDMQQPKNIKCPICGENQFDYVTTCTDYFTTKETFKIIRCKSCNFTLTSDIPKPNEIAKYYDSNDYISHSNTSKGFINSLYHYVRSFMLKRKCNLVNTSNNKKAGKLLDYGAGTGLFIKSIKEYKWDAIGIEINRHARENAKSWYNIDLIDSTEWNILEDESLDTITMWHVMEHVIELDNLWGCLNKKLKKEGKLIVALPNIDSYDAKHYGKYWAAYDVPRHVWHFSSLTFTRLASEKGFRVDKIKRMPFDGFYISMLSEKNKNKKLSIFKGVFHGAIGYIKALFNKRRSSSLIYILSKK